MSSRYKSAMYQRNLSAKVLELTSRALAVHYKTCLSSTLQRDMEWQLGYFIDIFYCRRPFFMEEVWADIEWQVILLERRIEAAEKTKGCDRPRTNSLSDRVADMGLRILARKKDYAGNGAYYSLIRDLGTILRMINGGYFPNPDTLPRGEDEEMYARLLQKVEEVESTPWTNRHLGKTANFARNLNFDR